MRHLITLLALFAALSLATLTGCGDDPKSTPAPAEPEPAPEPEPDPQPEPEPEPEPEPDPTPRCGNDLCEEGEDEANCPADCGGGACVEDAQSPNHSPEEATPLEIGQAIEDLRICADVVDFFVITLSEGDRVAINLSFSHAEGDLDLVVFGPDDPDFEEPVGISEGVEDNEAVAFVAGIAGDYVIAVIGFEGAEAAYGISADRGCLVDADCQGDQACDFFSESCVDYAEPGCGADGELDPNGSDSRASALDLGEDGQVLLDSLAICAEDVDFFSLSLGKGDSLRVKATPETEGAIMGLFLLTPEGALLANAVDPESQIQTLSAPHLELGDYIVVAALFVSEGSPAASNYALEVTVTVGTCQQTSDCVEAVGRPFCQGGVCAPIEGQGMVALGDPCDSDDDCGEDADLCYVDSNTAEGFLCTVGCRLDSHCAALGENAYCNTQEGICARGCENDGFCNDVTFCGEGRCRTCGSDDDCVGSEGGPTCLVPSFGAGGLCGALPEIACGDDANEPNNTYTQAKRLSLVEGAAELSDQVICNDDFDLHTIEITEPGTLTATLTYGAGADLDLWLLPEGGTQEIGLGISEEDDGEVLVAELIPAGRYSLRILQFPGEVDVETTYTLNVGFEPGTCADAAACTNTGVRRLSCVEGACVDFEGNGEVPVGGTCDTSDDCVLDAELCFQGAPEDDLNLCTITCIADEDCAAITGATCQDSGFFSFCLP